MTGGWAATNTLCEATAFRSATALHDYRDALARVEAALDAAVDDLMADGYPVNDPDLDGRDDPAYKDELVRQWGPKKVALAAALRAVREGR